MRLEPYLGFLHTSYQTGTLSLVCDFQEIYRSYVNDFVIQYLQGIKKGDFVTKTEAPNRRRRGKREYLNDSETREFMRDLNGFFESIVEVKRIRNGERQTLETLINEEALLFAKYLRNERKNGFPEYRTLINLAPASLDLLSCHPISPKKGHSSPPRKTATTS